MKTPIITPRLGQRSQVVEWTPSLLPFATSLRKGKFTYKNVFSPPRAWVLVSETGRGVYLKSQPRGKCCYSHCMCEIFAQLQASRSLSVRENSSGLDPRLPRNFRDMNQNSALSAE